MVAYASAGNGHRRAAEAIYSCFKKNHPEVEITLVDIGQYTNWLFAKLYSRGYSFLVVYLKAIWAIIYYLTNLGLLASWFKLFSRLNCRPFINLLLTLQPDIVLVTHFFPAEVVTYLKQKKRINPYLITIMTDFSLHRLWLFKDADGYIVGSDYTGDCLVAQGIKPDRIKRLGIPIDSRFSSSFKAKRQTKELSALLVTGAFGFTLIEKVVDMLVSEIRLLVVCGNNQKLYKRLESKQYQGIELFGFTNQIPKLMSQVDFIITKPGGLTIAEALTMELPMLFIGAIPGQEIANARILEGYGCAIAVKDYQSLRNVIIDLGMHPNKLDSMRTNIQKIKQPDAAEEICKYIMEDVCSGSI
jgi:processive 1,2-diacylglycerol beta-glucosyltransferase